MLAVQNMAASGTVIKDQEIEFNALSGSLSMMSKGSAHLMLFYSYATCSQLFLVLNDVLDL